MSYLQLRFQVDRDRAERLTSALDELGALSVTWENASDDDYFEIAQPRDPDWRVVNVTGLFDSSCRPDSVVRRVQEYLGDALIPQVSALDQQDWEKAHLDRAKPRKYAGDLWVCPSWIEPPDPGATNVVIDPGLAFGTGDHPTTALCLDWISENDLSGATVIDYGCGSGVLAVACLLRGADRAFGVDVDPRAVSASILNAERNGTADRYHAFTPEEMPSDFRADVVFANILSNVLMELSGVLTGLLRDGGCLLLTGVLEEHADRVAAAFDPAFAFDTRIRDGWCLLTGRKQRL